MRVRQIARIRFLVTLVISAGLLAGAAPAGQRPEVSRKVEIDNEQVLVTRIIIPPGYSSDMHSHALPSLEIFLTDDHIRETLPGGGQHEWRAKAGEVAWIAPATHRVENLRNRPTEIIAIEFKSLPAAALGVPTSEAVRELENDWVKVTHGRIEGRAKGSVHSHPNYIGVLLTDARLRAYLPDGSTRDLTGKRGDVSWREALTHSLENLADVPFEAVDVNLKPQRGN